jgi:arylsulfatase A-like enzyme
MPSVTRKQFINGALGTLLTSQLTGREARAQSVAPNVLFVIADEWRAQAFGYAGDPNAHTPAIDKFAAESVNLENAIAGESVCCPSRACLMTGQYPLTNNVYINDVPLKPKGVTLGETFQNAGYNTGYIGKWHLYGSPDGHYGRRSSFIPPDKRFGFEYWKANECTHNYNHSIYYEGDNSTPKFWDGYDAIAQTKDACEFIRKFRDADAPFFLFLSWGPPHFPLTGAPQQYQDMFKDRDIQLRTNVPKSDREKAIEDLRGYYAHGAALNDCFQSLLDTLEETGLAGNTIVVFTSDHGDMMYSQGLTTKLYPWEESIRIPLLIRYPLAFGLKGIRSQALINSPDIMPTLLGLSGIAVPKGVQGTDFSAFINGPSINKTLKSSFLCLPVPIATARQYGIDAYRGVRTERYTYVRSVQGPWLLYDNVNDPYQMHNLCNQSSVKSVQKALNDELNTWLHKLDDKFMPPDYYVKRDGLTDYIQAKEPLGYIVSPWGDWKSTLVKPALERPSIDTAIGDLLDDPVGRAVLVRHMPGFVAHPPYPGWRSASLRMLHAYMQRYFPASLNAMRVELAKLPPIKTGDRKYEGLEEHVPER